MSLNDFVQYFIEGFPVGCIYGLVAIGLVLTYKTSGVFNLAFGAQAYVSAAMYFKARVVWGWGTVPSVILAVFILAPLLGLVLERLIFRYLRGAGATAKLVAAIGLAVAIPALFDILAGFDAIAGQTPVGVVNNGASVFYDPFGSYAFSRDELVAMGTAVFAMLGLAALFRFSSVIRELSTTARIRNPIELKRNSAANPSIAATAVAMATSSSRLNAYDPNGS